MGNGQSIPHIKRGKEKNKNRLSKPKSKPGLSSSTGNSPNTSRRNSVVGNGVVTTTTTTTAPNNLHLAIPDDVQAEPNSNSFVPAQTPTKKKRMSIFRSMSSKKDKNLLQVDTNADPIPTNASSTGGRYTRSNSVNSIAVESTGDKSWIPTPSPRPSFHRHGNSLSSIPFLSNNDNNRLSLVAESISPRPDSIIIATGLIGHGETDWQLPDTSYHRTRSDPSIYAPIRRKSLLQHGVATRPSQPTRQSYQDQVTYNNFGRWAPPPLALRTSIDNISSGARTTTPNDLGHIGAYKLGSLRITNGSASPTPSEERRASLPSDDHVLAAVKAATQRSYTISVPAEAVKPRWTTEPQVHAAETQSENSFHDSLTIQIPNPKSTYHLASANNNLSLTLDLPMPELSPFSFVASPAPSPTLQATSKKNAVEDDLFAADLSTPTLEPSSGNDNKSFDSNYGLSPATPEQQALFRLQGTRESGAQPLAKTDSGYSSSTSRRSSVAPPLLSKDPLPASANDHLESVGNHPHSVNTHAVPMKSPSTQRAAIVDMASQSPNLNQSYPNLQLARNPHRQTMPAVPPGQLNPAQLASRWRSLQQRPVSHQPHSPLSVSQQSMPLSSNYYSGFESTGDRLNSREPSANGNGISMRPTELREPSYTRFHNALPPVPNSIPEEDYHSGWRPPNIRRHTFNPSAPTAPRNRNLSQPYHNPASLNTYPQEDQTDFEAYVTSFDCISSSLGASPYELALTATQKTPPRATPRAKSMTAEMAPPIQRKPVSRSVSEEPSLLRPVLSSRQASYNSIANANPFANGSTGPNSRTSSTGSAFTIRDLPSQRRTAEEDARRLSLARVDRVRSPPPNSMQAQRKTVSICAGPSTVPVLLAPGSGIQTPRTPSPRRQSSNGSPERQPPTPPSCGSLNTLHVQIHHDSMDHGTYLQPNRQMSSNQQSQQVERLPHRSQSARPPVQYHRPLPVHHYSFDFENSHSRRSSYSEKEWEIHVGDYNSSYGSQIPVQNIPDIDPSYYDEYPQRTAMENSEDILVLDRYAGGIGYDYKADNGMAKPERKNTGAMAAGYGLDFSDVPIFLQGVSV